VPSIYRPFTRQHLYFDRRLNDRIYQMPRLFPTTEAENVVIWVNGVGAIVDFMPWISNQMPSLQLGNAACQHFPLYLYGDAPPATDEPKKKKRFNPLDVVKDVVKELP
jgi:predicted helicase